MQAVLLSFAFCHANSFLFRVLIHWDNNSIISVNVRSFLFFLGLNLSSRDFLNDQAKEGMTSAPFLVKIQFYKTPLIPQPFIPQWNLCYFAGARFFSNFSEEILLLLLFYSSRNAYSISISSGINYSFGF